MEWAERDRLAWSKSGLAIRIVASTLVALWVCAGQQPRADLAAEHRARGEQQRGDPGHRAAQRIRDDPDGGRRDDRRERGARDEALVQATEQHQERHDDRAAAQPNRPESRPGSRPMPSQVSTS